MFDPDRLAAMMRQVTHFRRLPPDELQGIVRAGQTRRFGRDETLFAEGEPCAGLYVLLEGQVQLCKYGLQGQVSIIALLAPVIMFNEVAALDGGPNPVTAVATSDALAWCADASAFAEILLRYPPLALGLLQVLARRNRLLTQLYEDLSFRSVLSRVAKLLLELSRDGATRIERRRHTNAQMSGRVSTVPEAFSRSLRLLREATLVGCTEREIVVLDPATLRKVAETGNLAAGEAAAT